MGWGWSNAWRKEACGRQKLSYMWYSANCYRKPASPLHSMLVRRPLAATCWRRLRLKGSTREVLICQPSGLIT
jgi:hypothetical protein